SVPHNPKQFSGLLKGIIEPLGAVNVAPLPVLTQARKLGTVPVTSPGMGVCIGINWVAWLVQPLPTANCGKITVLIQPKPVPEPNRICAVTAALSPEPQLPGAVVLRKLKSLGWPQAGISK